MESETTQPPIFEHEHEHEDLIDMDCEMPPPPPPVSVCVEHLNTRNNEDKCIVKKRKTLSDDQKRILSLSVIKGTDTHKYNFVYAKGKQTTYMYCWRILGKLPVGQAPSQNNYSLEPVIYWKKVVLRWPFKESVKSTTNPFEGYTLSFILTNDEAEKYEAYENRQNEQIQQLEGFYKNPGAKNSIFVTPRFAYKSSMRFGVSYKVGGIIIESDNNDSAALTDLPTTIEVLDELDSKN
jgi:hypothetical protein